MAYTELLEEAKGLSESKLDEVLDYIKYLKTKDDSMKSNIVFDGLKGGLH